MSPILESSFFFTSTRIYFFIFFIHSQIELEPWADPGQLEEEDDFEK